jgi:hypothetical protein
MRCGEADVLIEVEALNLWPIDLRRLRQRGQELELR